MLSKGAGPRPPHVPRSSSDRTALAAGWLARKGSGCQTGVGDRLDAVGSAVVVPPRVWPGPGEGSLRNFRATAGVEDLLTGLAGSGGDFEHTRFVARVRVPAFSRATTRIRPSAPVRSAERQPASQAARAAQPLTRAAMRLAAPLAASAVIALRNPGAHGEAATRTISARSIQVRGSAAGASDDGGKDRDHRPGGLRLEDCRPVVPSRCGATRRRKHGGNHIPFTSFLDRLGRQAPTAQTPELDQIAGTPVPVNQRITDAFIAPGRHRPRLHCSHQ